MHALTPDLRIGVIGLGYVGLPLAVEFGRYYQVTGFDIRSSRIAALKVGQDDTHEVDAERLAAASGLHYSDDESSLIGCDVFIVTVPTPIDAHKRPDLAPLLGASETVGRTIARGAVVIYESTVYPGATEEDCVPVIEQFSGLIFNRDFHAGYSPERINPGDRVHGITSVIKVTSGSSPEAAEFVDLLYGSIVTAGTWRASSIRVAEAAKVIENTQRDINIALINELAMIFNRLGIDTEEVLEAAGTKWNFLPFRPGLVGGHCIGVDPYYLTHKAQATGYHPDMILSGRRVNDGMGAYVASQLVKKMTRQRIQVESARILLMGLTFKENCSDLRNSRVIDIIRELREYNVAVDVFDPLVEPEEAQREYAITPIEAPETGVYDAIVLAVAHAPFRALSAASIRCWGRNTHILYDLKHMLPREATDLRL